MWLVVATSLGHGPRYLVYPRPVISRVPRTDRRAAVLSALAVVATAPVLAACDATDTTPRSGHVSPTTDSAADDGAQVAAVARAIAGARAAALKLAKHDHAQRTWALGLAALHQQHLHKLGATGARPRTVHASTRQGLVTAEQDLQHRLVAACGRAQSGALAQVLASMAAAIGQRLVSA